MIKKVYPRTYNCEQPFPLSLLNSSNLNRSPQGDSNIFGRSWTFLASFVFVTKNMCCLVVCSAIPSYYRYGPKILLPLRSNIGVPLFCFWGCLMTVSKILPLLLLLLGHSLAQLYYEIIFSLNGVTEKLNVS